MSGDRKYLKEILDRNLVWTANDDEVLAFSAVPKLIQNLNEKLNIDKENLIGCWHVIKFNRSNLAQERILALTDKAYYFVHYDFTAKKIEENAKRHDLFHLALIDIGETCCKLYSYEGKKSILSTVRRATTIVFNSSDESEDSLQPNSSPRTANPSPRSLLRAEKRRSNSRTNKDDFIFQFEPSIKYLLSHSRTREKKASKPEKEKPSTAELYTNVFAPFDVTRTKSIVQEIAWSFYGAAALRHGSRM
jgi:hypothetical protein